MTSRSARLLLSQQEKSYVLGKLTGIVRRFKNEVSCVSLAYKDIRLVIDFDERVIEIITRDEFKRQYPTLSSIEITSARMTRAA